MRSRMITAWRSHGSTSGIPSALSYLATAYVDNAALWGAIISWSHRTHWMPNREMQRLFFIVVSKAPIAFAGNTYETIAELHVSFCVFFTLVLGGRLQIPSGAKKEV